MNHLKAFKLLASITILMVMFIVCFNMFLGPSLVPTYRDYRRIYKCNCVVSESEDDINNIDDNDNVGKADQEEELLLDELININEASSEELQTLPGIGEVIAENIIEYREENGDFQYEDELLNVEGIGEKKYDKIMDYITVK